ncbi:MAG: molybdenum cofactor biosynthesis protein B [Candidatus Kapaibacterium sp.]
MSSEFCAGSESALRGVVITVSDRSAAGEREDLSGPEAAQMLQEKGIEVLRIEVIPDDRELIENALRNCVANDVPLVLTTGGTGFAPRDVTPEATLAVIERRADGLTEAIRAASLAKTPYAMLSRAVCGIAGRTILLNLPGSPKGVRECLEVVLPVLPHALRLLRKGEDEH